MHPFPKKLMNMAMDPHLPCILTSLPGPVDGAEGVAKALSKEEWEKLFHQVLRDYATRVEAPIKMCSTSL